VAARPRAKAWRPALDDLVRRGLHKPELLIVCGWAGEAAGAAEPGMILEDLAPRFGAVYRRPFAMEQ
jgi:hypothetical protein